MTSRSRPLNWPLNVIATGRLLSVLAATRLIFAVGEEIWIPSKLHLDKIVPLARERHSGPRWKFLSRILLSKSDTDMVDKILLLLNF